MKGAFNVVTALEVANNVIRRALDEKRSLSPMKLQKLIYFIYARYYSETGIRLFSERFGTWKNGPVLDTVYQEFKTFGSSSIDRFCIKDNRIKSVDEDSSESFRIVIDDLWRKYKDCNGTELSKITHTPGSAWCRAVEERNPYLKDTDILDDGKNLFV